MTQKEGQPEPAAGKVAIVDGANVAHSGEADPPRLGHIKLICRKLEEEGFRAIVLVDAALRHRIDDSGEYERMVEAGEIRQAPAGTDADYFILSFAKEMDAAIVSNDRFRDSGNTFPEARDRIIRYMIVDQEVVLEHRARRRD
jgi:hypothetical protein